MPNLLSELVAKVKATDKTNKTVTVHCKSDIKDQIYITAASGSTANLGQRILFNTEFGSGGGHRYIQEIYIKGKINILAAGETIYLRGGILPAIEEIRLQVNEKNIFLVQNGLAEMHLWDKYHNYTGQPYRAFVNDNETFMGQERFLVNNSEAYNVATSALPAQKLTSSMNAALSNPKQYEFFLPLSTLTNMFKDISVAHLKKLSIQILLKKGSGAGTVQESLIYGNLNNTVSLNNLVQFVDLEMEVLFDVYKQPVINPKGALTVHDHFFERKAYPSTGTNPVKINLNNDFTPLENIRSMYLWNQDTVLGPADEASAFRRFTLNIGAWELRRNGIKVFDCKTRDEMHNHVRRYYNNRCRYRSLSANVDDNNYCNVTGELFIDFSRGTHKINNNHTRTHKFINHIKNFTQEFGQFEIIVNPIAAGWSPNTELVVTICATRLFHLMDSTSGYKVHEEL